MTTINVNTIAPAGSTLTVGDSGDTIVAPEVKVNTVKDAGGNTLWVSNGSGVLSSVSGFGGALKLISTQTADNDASLSFTSGIDSTYKEYVFKFIGINAATADADFTFQVNAAGASGYNETMTTTLFRAYHSESDSHGFGIVTSHDQSQGTAYQSIAYGNENDADACAAGELHLFNPASTTYVKHFYSTLQNMQDNATSKQDFTAGYIDTTTAVDEIQFKMASGNFDGKIKMYGVS